MVGRLQEQSGMKSMAERGAIHHVRPSAAQLSWLKRGLKQPGGKLPLFDEWGQRVNEQTIRSCIAQGWAEPWFANPLKPDWLVCKLSDTGRGLASQH
jgi:hypothetical protein